jgi:hypothetical protein
MNSGNLTFIQREKFIYQAIFKYAVSPVKLGSHFAAPCIRQTHSVFQLFYCLLLPFCANLCYFFPHALISKAISSWRHARYSTKRPEVYSGDIVDEIKLRADD